MSCEMIDRAGLWGADHVRRGYRMRTRMQEIAGMNKPDKGIKDRVCKYRPCSKVFTPRKKWQMYCCSEHHDLYWKELRELAGQMDREQ